MSDITPITATIETVSGEYEVLAYELVDESGAGVTPAASGWRLDVRAYEGAPLVAAWASEPEEGEGEIVIGSSSIVCRGLAASITPGRYEYALTTPAPSTGSPVGIYLWARGAFIVYSSTHQ